YFAADSTTRRIRDAYPAHVATMFRLMGRTDFEADSAARAVVRIETALAGRSRTLEQRRDPYANYNKMSLAEVARRWPSLALRDEMATMGIPAVDSVVVGQPEFYARADSLVRTTSMDDWKNYLRWNLVNTFAQRMSTAIDREDFAFYETLIEG